MHHETGSTRPSVPRFGSAPILAVCVGVILVLYRDHLRGAAWFPWDFLDSYTGMTYRYLSNPGILSGPIWMPWTSLGSPSPHAIQAGALYLPVEIFRLDPAAFGFHAATVLQVLHILLAFAGTYFLLRQREHVYWIAAPLALAYAISPGFFSNAEHTDIVRGYALLPWLLLVTSIGWLRKAEPLHIAVTAAVAWQFAVGAYVPALWPAALFVLVSTGCTLNWSDRSEVLRVLASLAIAATLALLMAAPRFLPAVLDPYLAASRIGGYVRMGLTLDELATLVYGYDYPGYSHDVTMRAIGVIPLIGLLALCAPLRSSEWRIAVLAIVLFVLGSATWPVAKGLQSMLHPAGRFPVADFRGLLLLALIPAAASGIRALRDPIERVHLVRLLPVGLLLCAAIAVGRIVVGVSGIAAFLCEALVVSSLLIVVWWLRTPPPANAVLVVLLVQIMLSSVAIAHQGGRTWKTPASEGKEAAIYGGDTVRSLISARIGVGTARPARIIARTGDGLPDLGVPHYSTFYARSWYDRSYAVFGYDNLKHTFADQRMASLRDGRDPAELLDFVLSPSATRLGTSVEFQDFAAAESCMGNADCRWGDRSVMLEQYGDQGSRYRIRTPAKTFLIENEGYWPGWYADLCDASGTCQTIESQPALGLLRSWEIPAGSFTLQSRFEMRGARASTFMFGLGCAGLAMLLAGQMLRTRRKS